MTASPPNVSTGLGSLTESPTWPAGPGTRTAVWMRLTHLSQCGKAVCGLKRQCRTAGRQACGSAKGCPRSSNDKSAGIFPTNPFPGASASVADIHNGRPNAGGAGIVSQLTFRTLQSEPRSAR
jgi:hypothetical protein